MDINEIVQNIGSVKKLAATLSNAVEMAEAIAQKTGEVQALDKLIAERTELSEEARNVLVDLSKRLDDLKNKSKDEISSASKKANDIIEEAHKKASEIVANAEDNARMIAEKSVKEANEANLQVLNKKAELAKLSDDISNAKKEHDEITSALNKAKEHLKGLLD